MEMIKPSTFEKLIGPATSAYELTKTWEAHAKNMITVILRPDGYIEEVKTLEELVHLVADTSEVYKADSGLLIKLPGLYQTVEKAINDYIGEYETLRDKIRLSDRGTVLRARLNAVLETLRRLYILIEQEEKESKRSAPPPIDPGW